MVSKVKLTYSVELFVKHESDEDLNEWLLSHTPEEAYDLAVRQSCMPPAEYYDEEVICEVMDDSDYDCDIT